MTPAQVLRKDQPAKVSVARYEDSALIARGLEQICIARLRKTDACDGNDIVSRVAQETRRCRPNVLVEEKPHADATAT